MNSYRSYSGSEYYHFPIREKTKYGRVPKSDKPDRNARAAAKAGLSNLKKKFV